MSLAEPISEEQHWATRYARVRIAHGNKFLARQLASYITFVQRALLKEYDTLSDAFAALAPTEESKGAIKHARICELLLLQTAFINPKFFRKLAEGFEKLKDTGRIDRRAEEIIVAYESCASFPPSFSELKRAFIDKFGDSRWSEDFSVRKTLQSLDLPLRPSKRGRPTGSKSRT
jgi:hypothetical protein